MIKYSFGPNSINSLFVMQKATSVAQLLDKLNKQINNRFAAFGNPIIIVDFGTWLKQLSWTDETGWFLTYRIAPLDKNLVTTKMLEDLFKEKFPTLFNQQKVEIISEGEDDSRKTTIIITDGRNSIGD